MGEAKRKLTATQKFIQQYPLCCFCGGLRPATTREHMPPKALFDDSHRPDKLIMPACNECNDGTRTADLVVSIVSRWDYHNPQKGQTDHKKLTRRASSQCPEIYREWLVVGEAKRLQGVSYLRSQGIPVPADAGIATIGPQTIRELNLFAHKVILGLFFEHYRYPLPNTGGFYAMWRSKEDFMREGIPKWMLDLFPNYGTLIQGTWNESEAFEYRFATNPNEGLFGCLTKFRNGLFVIGFAVKDKSLLPKNERNWLHPKDLFEESRKPYFQKKF